MDCRRTLVVALGLLSGAWGCSLRGGNPPPLPLEEPAGDARPAAELPKRQPKARTCLEYGRFCEREAQAKNRMPAEQEQFFEQARKMYQQALDIDKKNLEAAQALGRLYVNRGDHDRAVMTYQRALKYHPKEASLWSDLGMCHARAKEWEPALRNLRKAHELDPENRPLAHQLGYCLARAGRYDESLSCFRKTDGEAKAHYNLARMLYQMQQDDLSREHLRLALEKDPNLIPAKHLRAQLDRRPDAPGQVTPVGYERTVPPPPPGPSAWESGPPEPRTPAPMISPKPSPAPGATPPAPYPSHID